MSQYVNFYLIEKENGNKRHIFSWQSCNHIYEVLYDQHKSEKDEEGYYPITTDEIDSMELFVKQELSSRKELDEKRRKAKRKTREAMIETSAKSISQSNSMDNIRRILSEGKDILNEMTYDEINDEDDDDDYNTDLTYCLYHLNTLYTLAWECEFSDEWSGLCYQFDY